MRRAALLFLTAAMAVVVVLSSCSNDDDNESFSATTTTEEAAVTTLADSPYCQTLQRFNERYSQINPGLGDPAQFKTAMDDTVTAGKEAEANAPEAIKADLATLNAGLQDLYQLFQQAGFDVTKLNVNDLDRLQTTPQLQAAGERVEAFAQENCT